MEKEVFWNKPLNAFLIALLCCSLWGSAAPFIKKGYELFQIQSSDTFSILLFAGLRFFLAGIMVLIVGSLLQKKVMIPHKENIEGIVTLSIFQTIGQYFFFYVGLAYTSAVKGAIISGTSAFITLLVASLVFRYEKLTGRKVLGCVLGFIGILVMNLQGFSLATFSFTFLGEGFVLLSQVSNAFSATFIKKFTQKQDAVLLSGCQFTLGGIVLSLIGFMMGGRLHVTNGRAVLVLIYLAFLSATAYTLWGFLLKYNPVSRIGMYSFLTPLTGVLWSALLLHEADAFSVNGLIALTFVAAGIFIVNRSTLKTE